jgi:hypothetical protein
MDEQQKLIIRLRDALRAHCIETRQGANGRYTVCRQCFSRWGKGENECHKADCLAVVYWYTSPIEATL